MSGYELVLARGLVDERGDRHRRARLRTPSGREEALLAAWEESPGARAAGEFLAATLDRLGGFSPVDSGHTQALSRGDRARLGLALRSSLFGDRLILTLDCPSPACGSQADLILSIAALLGDPGPPQPEWIALETPDGTAWVRPPTGEDDALCETLTDRDTAAATLWSRLVGRLGERGPLTADDWAGLAPTTRHAIALALAESDESPDLALLSRCPVCRAWLGLYLDPFALLARELRAGSGRLLTEIHCLAFHYGWSESAILDLPRGRRHAYLDLLTRQTEGRPLSGHWTWQ